MGNRTTSAGRDGRRFRVPPLYSWDPRIDGWAEWGKQSRGWSESTMDNYRHRAHNWLKWCAATALEPDAATPR